MAAAILNQFTIGTVTIQSAKNEDRLRNGKPKTGLDDAVDLTKSASDASKVIAFAKSGLEAYVEGQKILGVEPSKLAKGAIQTCGTARAVLGAVRLPDVTRSAKEAIEGGVPTSTREGFQKARDLTDCVAAWLYAATLFCGAQLLNVANVFGFASDVASLPVDAGDAQLAQDILERAQTKKGELTPELYSRIKDTSTLAFLKMVKTAAAVATGALTMLTLAFGVVLVASSVPVGIGLGGAGVALYASYFEKTREQKLMKLDEVRLKIETKQTAVI